MAPPIAHRRLLVSGLIVAPFALISRAAPATAQSAPAFPPIVQAREKTKAGFLERARALRDQAVSEGDQAYGAVVVRDGIIVGEGRNYVVLQSDPTAHAELLAVRDAARRLNKRDLSDCEVYSTATPCPMCQGALYWARIRRYHNESTPRGASLQNSPASRRPGLVALTTFMPPQLATKIQARRKML
jgi:tRNA(Arg) A34 adenosine deaminase TadA